MKFLCLDCDAPMTLAGDPEPAGEGILRIVYACEACGRRTAMVTNPGETQMVSSLGVQIGHERIATEPMGTMDKLAGGAPLGASAPGPRWTEAAERRLAAAPPFVQGMVRRLYEDWAVRNGIEEMTPQRMNEARDALGMEGM